MLFLRLIQLLQGVPHDWVVAQQSPAVSGVAENPWNQFLFPDVFVTLHFRTWFLNYRFIMVIEQNSSALGSIIRTSCELISAVTDFG